ncbi:MAG: GNAT family N-acetyltransferase [Phycisphaerales bacterium]
MSHIIRSSDCPEHLPRPVAHVEFTIRRASVEDVPAMDVLQKLSSKALGFLGYKILEGYAADTRREVLIAENAAGDALGYVMGRDSYYGNEMCGYITHLTVHPDHRRSLIGATLIQTLFDRAAYGCRLYSCWCAQDLPANHFWEAVGFQPIAFRTGSEDKERIHIFWQRRIREGDTATPFWFPSKTRGGQIGEDRVALPIPPGTHWSDAKPMIIPGAEHTQLYLEAASDDAETERAKQEAKRLKAEAKAVEKKVSKAARAAHDILAKRDQKRERRMVSAGGLRAPSEIERTAEKIAEAAAEKVKESKAAAREARKALKKQQKRKYHPEFIDAAREFRDRFLESVHGEHGQNLIAPAQGKYDVARQLNDAGGLEGLIDRQLGAADEGQTYVLPPAMTDDFVQTVDDDVIDVEFEVREDDGDGDALRLAA